MKKPFFVMIYNQKGTHASPLIDERDEVVFFASTEEALEEMKDHIYAQAMGFEIFEMGTGETD